MRLLAFLLALAVPALAVGQVTDGVDLAAIQTAIANELRDPESARFRDVRMVGRTDKVIYVCGQLNAKNGYGGYTGWTNFYSPVIKSAGQYFPVLWLAGRIPLSTILEKCANPS